MDKLVQTVGKTWNPSGGPFKSCFQELERNRFVLNKCTMLSSKTITFFYFNEGWDCHFCFPPPCFCVVSRRFEPVFSPHTSSPFPQRTFSVSWYVGRSHNKQIWTSRVGWYYTTIIGELPCILSLECWKPVNPCIFVLALWIIVASGRFPSVGVSCPCWNVSEGIQWKVFVRLHKKCWRTFCHCCPRIQSYGGFSSL